MKGFIEFVKAIYEALTELDDLIENNTPKILKHTQYALFAIIFGIIFVPLFISFYVEELENNEV